MNNDDNDLHHQSFATTTNFTQLSTSSSSSSSSPSSSSEAKSFHADGTANTSFSFTASASNAAFSGNGSRHHLPTTPLSAAAAAVAARPHSPSSSSVSNNRPQEDHGSNVNNDDNRKMVGPLGSSSNKSDVAAVTGDTKAGNNANSNKNNPNNGDPFNQLASSLDDHNHHDDHHSHFADSKIFDNSFNNTVGTLFGTCDSAAFMMTAREGGEEEEKEGNEAKPSGGSRVDVVSNGNNKLANVSGGVGSNNNNRRRNSRITFIEGEDEIINLPSAFSAAAGLNNSNNNNLSSSQRNKVGGAPTMTVVPPSLSAFPPLPSSSAAASSATKAQRVGRSYADYNNKASPADKNANSGSGSNKVNKTKKSDDGGGGEKTSSSNIRNGGGGGGGGVITSLPSSSMLKSSAGLNSGGGSGSGSADISSGFYSDNMTRQQQEEKKKKKKKAEAREDVLSSSPSVALDSTTYRKEAMLNADEDGRSGTAIMNNIGVGLNDVISNLINSGIMSAKKFSVFDTISNVIKRFEYIVEIERRCYGSGGSGSSGSSSGHFHHRSGNASSSSASLHSAYCTLKTRLELRSCVRTDELGHVDHLPYFDYYNLSGKKKKTKKKEKKTNDQSLLDGEYVSVGGRGRVRGRLSISSSCGGDEDGDDKKAKEEANNGVLSSSSSSVCSSSSSSMKSFSSDDEADEENRKYDMFFPLLNSTIPTDAAAMQLEQERMKEERQGRIDARKHYIASQQRLYAMKFREIVKGGGGLGAGGGGAGGRRLDPCVCHTNRCKRSRIHGHVISEEVHEMIEVEIKRKREDIKALTSIPMLLLRNNVSGSSSRTVGGAASNHIGAAVNSRNYSATAVSGSSGHTMGTAAAVNSNNSASGYFASPSFANFFSSPFGGKTSEKTNKYDSICAAASPLNYFDDIRLDQSVTVNEETYKAYIKEQRRILFLRSPPPPPKATAATAVVTATPTADLHSQSPSSPSAMTTNKNEKKEKGKKRKQTVSSLLGQASPSPLADEDDSDDEDNDDETSSSSSSASPSPLPRRKQQNESNSVFLANEPSFGSETMNHAPDSYDISYRSIRSLMRSQGGGGDDEKNHDDDDKKKINGYTAAATTTQNEMAFDSSFNIGKRLLDRAAEGKNKDINAMAAAVVFGGCCGTHYPNPFPKTLVVEDFDDENDDEDEDDFNNNDDGNTEGQDDNEEEEQRKRKKKKERLMKKNRKNRREAIKRLADMLQNLFIPCPLYADYNDLCAGCKAICDASGCTCRTQRHSRDCSEFLYESRMGERQCAIYEEDAQIVEFDEEKDRYRNRQCQVDGAICDVKSPPSYPLPPLTTTSMGSNKNKSLVGSGGENSNSNFGNNKGGGGGVFYESAANSMLVAMAKGDAYRKTQHARDVFREQEENRKRRAKINVLTQIMMMMMMRGGGGGNGNTLLHPSGTNKKNDEQPLPVNTTTNNNSGATPLSLENEKDDELRRKIADLLAQYNVIVESEGGGGEGSCRRDSVFSGSNSRLEVEDEQDDDDDEEKDKSYSSDDHQHQHHHNRFFCRAIVQVPTVSRLTILTATTDRWFSAQLLLTIACCAVMLVFVLRSRSNSETAFGVAFIDEMMVSDQFMPAFYSSSRLNPPIVVSDDGGGANASSSSPFSLHDDEDGTVVTLNANINNDTTSNNQQHRGFASSSLSTPANDNTSAGEDLLRRPVSGYYYKIAYGLYEDAAGEKREAVYSEKMWYDYLELELLPTLTGWAVPTIDTTTPPDATETKTISPSTSFTLTTSPKTTSLLRTAATSTVTLRVEDGGNDNSANNSDNITSRSITAELNSVSSSSDNVVTAGSSSLMLRSYHHLRRSSFREPDAGAAILASNNDSILSSSNINNDNASSSTTGEDVVNHTYVSSSQEMTSTLTAAASLSPSISLSPPSKSPSPTKSASSSDFLHRLLLQQQQKQFTFSSDDLMYGEFIPITPLEISAIHVKAERCQNDAFTQAMREVRLREEGGGNGNNNDTAADENDFYCYGPYTKANVENTPLFRGQFTLASPHTCDANFFSGSTGASDDLFSDQQSSGQYGCTRYAVEVPFNSSQEELGAIIDRLRLGRFGYSPSARLLSIQTHLYHVELNVIFEIKLVSEIASASRGASSLRSFKRIYPMPLESVWTLGIVSCIVAGVCLFTFVATLTWKFKRLWRVLPAEEFFSAGYVTQILLDVICIGCHTVLFVWCVWFSTPILGKVNGTIDTFIRNGNAIAWAGSSSSLSSVSSAEGTQFVSAAAAANTRLFEAMESASSASTSPAEYFYNSVDIINAQEPNLRVLLQTMAYRESIFNILCVLCVISIFFRLLPFASIFTSIHRVTLTITNVAGKTLSLLLIFLIVIAGFGICGVILFGQSVFDFQSFSRSIALLFNMLIGNLNYDAMGGIDSPGAFIFTFLYLITGTCVFLNFIIAILTDSIKDVQLPPHLSVGVFLWCKVNQLFDTCKEIRRNGIFTSIYFSLFNSVVSPFGVDGDDSAAAEGDEEYHAFLRQSRKSAAKSAGSDIFYGMILFEEKRKEDKLKMRRERAEAKRLDRRLKKALRALESIIFDDDGVLSMYCGENNSDGRRAHDNNNGSGSGDSSPSGGGGGGGAGRGREGSGRASSAASLTPSPVRRRRLTEVISRTEPGNCTSNEPFGQEDEFAEQQAKGGGVATNSDSLSTSKKKKDDGDVFDKDQVNVNDDDDEEDEVEMQLLDQFRDNAFISPRRMASPQTARSRKQQPMSKEKGNTSDDEEDENLLFASKRYSGALSSLSRRRRKQLQKHLQTNDSQEEVGEEDKKEVKTEEGDEQHNDGEDSSTSSESEDDDDDDNFDEVPHYTFREVTAWARYGRNPLNPIDPKKMPPFVLLRAKKQWLQLSLMEDSRHISEKDRERLESSSATNAFQSFFFASSSLSAAASASSSSLRNNGFSDVGEEGVRWADDEVELTRRLYLEKTREFLKAKLIGDHMAHYGYKPLPKVTITSGGGEEGRSSNGNSAENSRNISAQNSRITSPALLSPTVAAPPTSNLNPTAIPRSLSPAAAAFYKDNNAKKNDNHLVTNTSFLHVVPLTQLGRGGEGEKKSCDESKADIRYRGFDEQKRERVVATGGGAGGSSWTLRRRAVGGLTGNNGGRGGGDNNHNGAHQPIIMGVGGNVDSDYMKQLRRMHQMEKKREEEIENRQPVTCVIRQRQQHTTKRSRWRKKRRNSRRRKRKQSHSDENDDDDDDSDDSADDDDAVQIDYTLSYGKPKRRQASSNTTDYDLLSLAVATANASISAGQARRSAGGRVFSSDSPTFLRRSGERRYGSTDITNNEEQLEQWIALRRRQQQQRRRSSVATASTTDYDPTSPRFSDFYLRLLEGSVGSFAGGSERRRGVGFSEIGGEGGGGWRKRRLSCSGISGSGYDGGGAASMLMGILRRRGSVGSGGGTFNSNAAGAPFSSPRPSNGVVVVRNSEKLLMNFKTLKRNEQMQKRRQQATDNPRRSLKVEMTTTARQRRRQRRGRWQGEEGNIYEDERRGSGGGGGVAEEGDDNRNSASLRRRRSSDVDPSTMPSQRRRGSAGSPYSFSFRSFQNGTNNQLHSDSAHGNYVSTHPGPSSYSPPPPPPKTEDILARYEDMRTAVKELYLKYKRERHEVVMK